MIAALRSATADAHRRLETALGLLDPPLRKARFVEVLAGFAAFHRTWEPRVEELIADEAFMVPRRRGEHLARDLATLGYVPAPAPAPDLSFLHDASAAWGSLYVMEGSALGGQVISRALAEAPWAPPGGLAYFNPYGERTGRMWRGFRERLEREAAGLDRTAVCEGARRTFALLEAELASLHRAA